MAATAFGAIFYFFTVVASLKSLDCPKERGGVHKVLSTLPQLPAVFVEGTFGTVSVSSPSPFHVLLCSWRELLEL